MRSLGFFTSVCSIFLSSAVFGHSFLEILDDGPGVLDVTWSPRFSSLLYFLGGSLVDSFPPLGRSSAFLLPEV